MKRKLIWCGTPQSVAKHQGVKQVISRKYPTHKSQIFIIFKESELKYVLTSKMESRVFSCVEAWSFKWPSLIPSLGKVCNKPAEICFCKKKAAALSVLAANYCLVSYSYILGYWYCHVQLHICDSIYSCLEKIIGHVHISGCFANIREKFGCMTLYSGFPYRRLGFTVHHVNTDIFST